MTSGFMQVRSWMSVFTASAALFWLAACGETEAPAPPKPAPAFGPVGADGKPISSGALIARQEQACAEFADFDRLFERSHAGDLAAVDCLIATEDAAAVYAAQHDLGRQSVEFRRQEAAVWRYMRWVVTGEEPPGLIESMAGIDRSPFMDSVYFKYSSYIAAMTGEPYGMPKNKAGCTLRPPRLDRLWRAARPDDDSAGCHDAVGGNPDH